MKLILYLYLTLFRSSVQDCEKAVRLTPDHMKIVLYLYLTLFRSSLQDCERAVRLTPDHMKAIIRGAQCCIQLKHYQLCQVGDATFFEIVVISCSITI